MPGLHAVQGVQHLPGAQGSATTGQPPAVHVGRQSARILRRSARIGAKNASAGHGVSTAVVVTVTSAIVVSAAVVTGAAFIAGHRDSPSAQTAAAAPPPLAYVTANSVVLRTPAGQTKILGKAPSSQVGSSLVWSPDGTQFAWATGGNVVIAQAASGSRQSWACSGCSEVAFQGDKAVSVLGKDAGAPETSIVAVPELQVFSFGQAAPVVEQITGISRGPGTDFHVLAAISGGDLIVAYGDSGGSDFGGPQTLYRIDSAGKATIYHDTEGNEKFTGSIPNVATDSAGDELAVALYTREGACGGVEAAFVLNTVTGNLALPNTPSSGGGPGGFWVQSLWFDSQTAYVSFTPNPSDCSTSANPPEGSAPPHATPIVCKLVGNQWVPTANGVIRAAYAPGGWTAQQSGTPDGPDFGGSSGSGTLTISNGRTSTVINGVRDFAWAP
jgi:hypothetical protein